MNRKGFTLTELLVVVAILAIIAGLSIPLIRNISAAFNNRKYAAYADTVEASAKLYNDSYSEDLFGRKEYGCSYITYEKLEDKGLLKDINIDNISCNSDETFVKVIKNKDKYNYHTYLGCGKKTDGEMVVSKRYPEGTTEVINYNSCTGSSANNIGIDIVKKNMDKPERKKTTRLVLSSGTGINNHISIYTAWSKNPTGFSEISDDKWAKASFEVMGNQKELIAEGETVWTKSNTLTTPSDDAGDYYLLVRVDDLKDLYGVAWQNTLSVGGVVAASDGRYISYGPFKTANTAPSIKAEVYKCNSSGNITGTSIVSKQGTTLETEDITGDNNNWINATDFRYGVCLRLTATSDNKIATYKREWNEKNISGSDDNYKNIVDEEEVEITNEDEYVVETSIRDSGHRYLIYSFTDITNNTAKLTVDLKMDIIKPECGEDSVDNTDKKVTIECNDEGGSGCKKASYTKTYSTDSTTETITISDKAENTTDCTVKVGSNTNPKLTAKVYKCDSSHKATGSVLTEKTSTSDFSLKPSTWYNKSSYPNGICIKYSYTSSNIIKNGQLKYNSSGYSTSDSRYANLTTTEDPKTCNSTSCSDSTWFAASGYRYSTYKVKDQFDQTTTASIYLKIDKDNPTATCKPSKTGATSGKINVTVSCKDSVSGCDSGAGTFYSVNSSKTYTVKDKAGNSDTCKITKSFSYCNIDHIPKVNCDNYGGSWVIDSGNTSNGQCKSTSKSKCDKAKDNRNVVTYYYKYVAST